MILLKYLKIISASVVSRPNLQCDPAISFTCFMPGRKASYQQTGLLLNYGSNVDTCEVENHEI